MDFVDRQPRNLFRPEYNANKQLALREDAKTPIVPVKSFHGTDLSFLQARRRDVPDLTKRNRIADVIDFAEQSGLGAREAAIRPLNRSQKDREHREQVDDTVPRTVIQLDNHFHGKLKFHYTKDNEVLRLEVLPLTGALRVNAEVISRGQKAVITHSISGGETAGPNAYSGYNRYKTVWLTVGYDGSLKWDGDALVDMEVTGKLLEPEKYAKKLINLITGIHDGSSRHGTSLSDY